MSDDQAPSLGSIWAWSILCEPWLLQLTAVVYNCPCCHDL